MKHRTRAVAIIGIVGTAFAFAACGGSAKGSASSSSKNTFVLSEFTIVPPTNTLHAGKVSISAKNVGGEVHELMIVRADSVGALPMKSDGSVNEEKIAATQKVGEITDVAPGSHKSKAFALAPGNYVAFCNITDAMMGSGSTMMGGSGMGSGTGHIHFAQGMHEEFTVT